MGKASNSTSSNMTDSSETLIKLLITLVNEIKECISGKLTEVIKKLEQQENKQKEMLQTIEDLKNDFKEQQQRLTALKQSETTSVKTTTAQQGETKQRGLRCHNLIITCEKIENEPKDYVESLFLEKYNKKPNIIAVQELKKNSKSDTIQTKIVENQTKLLVTLHSVWEARQIYKDRVQVLKNTGIYIQEDLSRDESYMFYRARQLKKMKIITQTWTENGSTYYKEKMDSVPQIMNDKNPLLEKIEKSKNNFHEMHVPMSEINKKSEDSQLKQSKSMNKEDKLNLIYPTIGNIHITNQSETSSSDESINTIKEQQMKKRKLRKNKKKRNASE